MTTLASATLPLATRLRRLFGNRAMLAGAVILAVVVLAALLAPAIAPYAPTRRAATSSWPLSEFWAKSRADTSGTY